jgi:hypothetical protein
MVDWAKDRLLIRAGGGLSEQCVLHHQTSRAIGDYRLPQHDIFVITDGSGMFGMMAVKPFTREHHFETEDDEIQRNLLKPVEALKKE